jgi:hypothetical protein
VKGAFKRGAARIVDVLNYALTTEIVCVLNLNPANLATRSHSEYAEGETLEAMLIALLRVEQEQGEDFASVFGAA